MTASGGEVKCKSLSCVRLSATPWTIQSMEFSKKEYWNGLHCLSPVDLPGPGIEPKYLSMHVDSLPSEPSGKPQYRTDIKRQNRTESPEINHSLLCSTAN